MMTSTRMALWSRKKPVTAKDWKIQNLVKFVDAIEACGEDEEKLKLFYENLSISLGESQLPYRAFLEHYEEKLEVLRFIASSSFVQEEGQKARRIEHALINRFVWAAIWVAPIETFREWKTTIDNDEPLHFDNMTAKMKALLPELVNIWKGKNPSGSSNVQPRPARMEAPKRAALERDNYRCVILGSHDPQVAHIYPYASILNASRCSTMTRFVLREVWGDDAIRKFMDLMNMNHVDVAENMISLCCQIHFWLDHLKIALEPVEAMSNPHKLFVRVRHLADSNLRPKRKGVDPTVPLDTDPKKVLEDLMTGATGSAKQKIELSARHFNSGEPIRDGHMFLMETNDPQESPLPSIEIMKVAYRMALMIQLAGAAEDDDEYDDEEYDDAPDAPDAPEDSVGTPDSETNFSAVDYDSLRGSE
ncbi:hypothetical protein CGRA01v4_09579 [Colletotrichum graminicola]|uniref:HNH nuclease domain-containing protein n=1 Tax=Colletotrichum graminicola (strain M1.001 / M2 / FGSC 10212) TaxID=645133 RepID=E3QP07_COLGM|nr:uncharacterized protein GLRG_07609 [Colletotrichum graminicola M1.001]EFQ32595.1 hypothetical protein GLRG_07609 [Colletotrichum graminicola M1.001]WDK18294.1 hypothetical protein CGRA01v4_09579 [Colletotrichum graminicola]